jgi:hypothetical protein
VPLQKNLSGGREGHKGIFLIIFATLVGNKLSIIEPFQLGIKESMRFDTKASEK